MRSASRKAICLACLALVTRQIFALAPDRKIAQYIHDVWRAENGLPQNTVRDILQTRDGYIWLATDEGLVRFDGLHFTVFDKQNTAAIRSNNIQVLYEDRQANLWIGTDKGLVRLKDQRFVCYSTAEGLSNVNIRSIYEDHRGDIWVGTLNGLNRFRDERFDVYTIKNGLPSNSINSVYEDRAGSLWINTSGGLARFDGERFTTYGIENGFPAGTVTAVLQSRDGDLWFGTSGGLVRFKDDRFTTYTTKDGLANNMVWALCEDHAGNLWIGTDGGLCLFKEGRLISYTTRDGLSDNSVMLIREDRDGNLWLGTAGGLTRFKDGRFDVYTARDGLSNNVILAIYEDREGNLWVGTEAGGLNVFKDTKFITYDSRDGLSDDMVWTVYQSHDGSIWIGTQSGGLNRFKDGSIAVYTTEDGLPSNTVRALCEDHEGALWIGTPRGLVRFKDGRFRTYTVQDGLSSDAVWAIHEDSNGQLWIGTLGGLTRYKGGKFTIYTTSDGLSDDAVLAIQSTPDGALWIGTRNGGLNLFKDGKFTAYTTDHGLSDNNVRAIYRDREGTLWIGTRRGGLNRLKDGRLTSYTTREGLADDCVYQILEDEQNNLWMSCAKGIFRVNRQELNAFAEGKIEAIHSISYGTEDGMGSRECNGGQPAGWRSADGRLWFPTMRGVTVIAPESLKINRTPPSVVLEQVIADGTAYDPTQRAELPANTNRIEFQYTGLSFVAPEKVRFKYKLEGFDKDWIDAGTKRTVSYTNIPPGNYKFRVIACNNDGTWNEAGASFAFHLKPRFYQTLWFYSLLGVAILLLGWFIYRLRLKQVQARFAAVLAERNRMAREIHDALAQGFVGIGLQLEAMEKALAESPQMAKRHLEIAQRMVSYSLAEASRLVWDLRSPILESGNLAEALSEIARRLTSGTTVQVEMRISGSPRRLAESVESNLLRIGQEAITNAIKHARPRRIDVELSFEPQRVILRVKDDGCGWDLAGNDLLARNGHFGLLNMSERAKQIKGQLAISSRPGEGTEVKVAVPIT